MHATHHALDHWLIAADTALRTLSGGLQASRPNPAADLPLAQLDPTEKRLVGGLMRVNHVGEVCAQALYEAQALTAQTPANRLRMKQAAVEEVDHLAWTADRLRQLGDRPSLLNPLWFAGAFGIGLLAGKAGDAVSLGFLKETERQVEAHLASHLERLPSQDKGSRAIVEQMKRDEAAHAEMADQAGASDLPQPVKTAMKLAAKVMTTVAFRL
ncbi:2-polyprenyl-3-methyl-6-methoxy-1,4-benzoquinone monooxygenase [Ideonella paludis]|uniref:3-demethoxyubiquinol 3-hydroxylase n=1 Tax=Ideonella paludis TaxID=1233411 RepID=A0ABS5E341_9BURK|nr:2-polyprenyl-3-methyl-6-methoxy-1,4-benzoquinone monooxygenase [Ideonella paludis]MBQ0937431.1 2-polyprenyl-3-methyl-6-methoxy-1,4-benzoquinone monooxygenase [Ideonella paludis]